MQQVLSTSIAATLLGILLFTGCERPPREGDEAEAQRREHREERRERDRERERERDRREGGQVETRNFPVSAFDNIELRGAAEVQINIGPEPSVQMTGTSKVLSGADVEVTGSRLEVDFAKGRRWFGDTGRLKIVITTPTLKELESNGAGDMKLEGLAAGDLEMRLSGAHNVHASGTIEDLKLELEGAGNVDFRDVTVTKADVTVSGAGNVEVHVENELKAEVNGVGAIRYSGDPQKVDSKLHGLGTISRQSQSRQNESRQTDKDASRGKQSEETKQESAQTAVREGGAEEQKSGRE